MRRPLHPRGVKALRMEQGGKQLNAVDGARARPTEVSRGVYGIDLPLLHRRDSGPERQASQEGLSRDDLVQAISARDETDDLRLRLLDFLPADPRGGLSGLPVHSATWWGLITYTLYPSEAGRDQGIPFVSHPANGCPGLCGGCPDGLCGDGSRKSAGTYPSVPAHAAHALVLVIASG